MKMKLYLLAILLATAGFCKYGYAAFKAEQPIELFQQRKVDYFIECGVYVIHIYGYVDYSAAAGSPHLTVTVEINHNHETKVVPVIFTGNIKGQVYYSKNRYMVKGEVKSEDRGLLEMLMSRLYLPRSGNVKEVEFEKFK